MKSRTILTTSIREGEKGYIGFVNCSVDGIRLWSQSTRIVRPSAYMAILDAVELSDQIIAVDEYGILEEQEEICACESCIL